MAFFTAGIFANESRWKTDSIYFSTELGRKKGTIAKLMAGFFVTTVVYWTILLVVNLAILTCMGFEGANNPIQSDYHFWYSIYNLTFSQRSILALLDGYLLWLFLTAMVMIVSALSGSVSLAVVVPALLMLGSNYLDRNSGIVEMTKFIMLFPHKMTTAYMNEPIVLYSVAGKILPPITIQRILYFCLVILMTVLCYRIFRRKQVR